MKTNISYKKSNLLYDGTGYEGIITLFTPTYNRARFLGRIYDCLMSQTSKKYVWIIVNDGSTDESDAICQKILKENTVPVLYIRKENGGKHSAFKVALDQCKTEFFQCMDDDDVYSPKSVETFLRLWAGVDSSEIGAIRTLSQLQNGSFVVSESDICWKYGTFEDCSTLEMNYIRRSKQENWTCYRTAALKQIDLFPEDYWLSDKHTFFSEAIWQGRFARKYKCRYHYIALRTYTDDADTSILRSNKSEKHYLNMFINTKMLLDEQLDFIFKNPVAMFKSIAMLQLLRGFLNIPLRELLSNTPSSFLKGFYILSSVISVCGKKVISSRRKK